MKKKLLFLLGDFNNRNRNAIAATCAWLAEANGYLFELYYDSYRTGKHYCGEPFRFKNGIIPVEDYFGGTVLGGGHHEQFYFLNNAFETEFILTDTPTVFESSVRAFRSLIISEEPSVSRMYAEIFGCFTAKIPDTLTILGTAKSDTFPLGADVYSFPEVFYTRTIGVSDVVSTEELENFRKLGVSKVRLIDPSKQVENACRALGFEVVDVVSYGGYADYGELTVAIAEKWDADITQISICDPVLSSYWMPWLCRHKALPVFSFDLPGTLPAITRLAKKHRQRVIYGRQNCDGDILALAKENLVLQIVDPNRPPFPVVEELDYKWAFEKVDYSQKDVVTDEQLVAWAKEGKVLGSLLFHAGDARHSDIIWRIFDFVAMYKLKIGIGITADWWNFMPELMEMTSIPMDKGGMYPYVEPILYAGGLGITAEGAGYHDTGKLMENLDIARAQIMRIAGKDAVPKGYYTFLDIQLRDWSIGFDELYQEVAKRGFDYLVTSLHPGKSEVHYEHDDFVTVNHSVPFFSFYSNFIRANNLDDIINCEDIYREHRQPGWVLAALDSPIWGFEYAPWECGYKLKEISDYMTTGGNTGNLVNTTPGTIARYAKILKDMDLLG